MNLLIERLCVLVLARFGAVALVCTEIESVVTGRAPYNSWGGALSIFLAALLWALGDVLVKEIE